MILRVTRLDRSHRSQTPPLDLAARIGGAYGDYHKIGAGHRRALESVLPSDWSFENRTVLDFGCGTGRTLAAFAEEAQKATLVGCDIHGRSIDWANSNLSPPFSFFRCDESPPLPEPDARFDLIYAMSVFTHITELWSQWLAELHRVIRPGGLAVITILGPAMAQHGLGINWDDRIGMARIDLHKDWDIGGPDVLLSEWWVREHWGRAFDIIRYEHADPLTGAAHDLVAMRRREVEVTPESLASIDAADPREHAALICNLEMTWRQQEALGSELRALRNDRMAAEVRTREVEAELQSRGTPDGRDEEIARLRAQLHEVTQSKSWRLTAGLRRVGEMARRRF